MLIYPGRPNIPWFWDLLAMSCQINLCTPNLPDLLTQPFNLESVQPKSSCLTPAASAIKDQGFSEVVVAQIEAPPDQFMRQSGPVLQSGAKVIRWTSGHHLSKP